MLLRRLSIASLIALILVTVASIILVYVVSPLRDQAFQPNGANAGTSVWWVKGVKDDDWVRTAVILAGLLSTNTMLVLWTLRIARQISMLMLFGLWMWILLYYVFLFYLLAQWIVD